MPGLDEFRDHYLSRDTNLEAFTSPSLDVLFRDVGRVEQDSAWFRHAPFASWATQAARPRTLVELGGDNGVSYSAFCHAVQAAGLPANCFAVHGNEAATAEFADYNARHFSGFSQMLPCAPEAAAALFADGTVDLLHVDGERSEVALRALLQLWLPKLSGRAILLLHGVNDRRDGCTAWRLWAEMTERWPAFEFVQGRGLGLACVGMEAPVALRALCDLSAEDAARVRARFAFLGERWEAERRVQALRRRVAEAGQALEDVRREAADAHAAAAVAARDQAAALAAAQESAAREHARLLAAAAASGRAAATAEAAMRNAVSARLAAERVSRQVSESRITEIQRLEAKAAHLQYERDRVLNSFSWRASGPFRRTMIAMPQGYRSTARRTARLAWWMATPWLIPARLRVLRPGGSDAPARQIPAGADADAVYAQWIDSFEHAPQRSGPPADPAATRLFTQPRFSLLLAGRGAGAAVLATVRSLRRQTMADWQLLLPGGPADYPILAPFRAERRVVFTGVSATERGAVLAALLEHASGEWAGVLDAGDVLAPDALTAAAAALDVAPEAAILYGDEDRLTPAGKRTAPQFKPSWSPELLQAYNYLGRLTLMSRAVIAAAGGFAPGHGAGAEWSLHLRSADAAQAAGQSIVRLPRVLCHRGVEALGDRPDATTSAAAENRAVLQAYWSARGVAAVIETQPDGTQRSRWDDPEPPLVSIVIPNRNNADALARCLDGVLRETDYRNIQVVIVENHSDDPATWALYTGLQTHKQVEIVHFAAPFNYSAACNHGARFARGSLLLFLNNDVEVIDPGWLGELVRVATLPGVGVAGAKLRFPDGAMQHGGVAIGAELYGLMYRRCPEGVWDVFGSADHTRNCSAIMGACQMVTRQAFDHAGGFDEGYGVANSDVALCLRTARLGYRVAYTPFAALVHHEGKTRGWSNPAADMARAAREVQRLGIVEDPFLHPGLSGNDPTPRLRLPGERSPRDALREAAAGPMAAPASPAFDLFDDGALLGLVDAPARALFWPPLPVPGAGPWALCRWVIDLLRARADLRVRFPRALSAGKAGDFARFLTREAFPGLKLTAQAVDEMFDLDPASRARQVVFWSEDFRAGCPLALLPPGRAELVAWMFAHRPADHGLRLEEIWWFLMGCAEDPAAELVRTYRFTPDWQLAHPQGLTVFGCHAFAVWLAERYRLPLDTAWLNPASWNAGLSPADHVRIGYAANEAWRIRHPRAFDTAANARALLSWLCTPEARLTSELHAWCRARLADGMDAELTRLGVNIIGHYCHPSGLRVSVEAMSDAMDAAGVAVIRRDIRTDASDDPHHGRFDGLETHDVTIIHTQPEPYFKTSFTRADAAERSPRSYRVGYWYWELDTVPAYWDDVAQSVDELWTATSFVAEALRRTVHVPVHTLFPGVHVGRFTRRPREALGAPGRGDGRFAFLFSFHMASITERKNPFGLIAAFKQAFSPSEKVDLVLKTTSASRYDAELTNLFDAAVGANITVLDRVFSPDETLSLMDSCDAYVSLHRAEGLGLTMAEAMLLGKPVIATRYSGNLEFMNDDNSLLVDCAIRPLGRPVPPYDASAVWAEPSVDHAARLMRRVFDDQAWAAALGLRGQADAMRRMSREAAGQRFTARLAQIRTSLGTP